MSHAHHGNCRCPKFYRQEPQPPKFESKIEAAHGEVTISLRAEAWVAVTHSPSDEDGTLTMSVKVDKRFARRHPELVIAMAKQMGKSVNHEARRTDAEGVDESEALDKNAIQ